jgi:ATP/maltotriose-dependent transcriptional regulator MalT
MRIRPFTDSGHKVISTAHGNRHRALTLFSAPPGYGKSMLASMWMETTDWPSVLYRNRPLTLISTPADYGTSTLASMRLEASGDAGA